VTALQFLVIGAEKAGTTSLFEYLRRHPEIHMPAEKELSFFSLERNFNRGWDWYIETALRNSASSAVCGEASVGYMMGTPFRQLTENEHIEPDLSNVMSPLERVIPERIKNFLPDIKLLCVLRDPIDRAYSHYRMARLNNVESRSFDEAVELLLSPTSLEDSRTLRTQTNGYIANGEYARILAGYFGVFRPDQIMVVFSDDLANEAAATVARVFDFVGVSSQFIPDNIGARYRAGAEKQRLSALDLYAWQRTLGSVRAARSLWRLLPQNARFRVSNAVNVASYRMALWNRRNTRAGDSMNTATRQMLAAHFNADSQRLGNMIGADVPWLNHWKHP
jgi:hypothetical protein